MRTNYQSDPEGEEIANEVRVLSPPFISRRTPGPGPILMDSNLEMGLK